MRLRSPNYERRGKAGIQVKRTFQIPTFFEYSKTTRPGRAAPERMAQTYDPGISYTVHPRTALAEGAGAEPERRDGFIVLAVGRRRRRATKQGGLGVLPQVLDKDGLALACRPRETFDLSSKYPGGKSGSGRIFLVVG